jgi:hypothetical protein
MYTAEQILNIPVTEPERLFSKDAVKDERLTLIKAWHPDHNHDPKAGDVFHHIQVLYEKAVERIEAGFWKTPGVVEIPGLNGKKYVIRFQKEHTFDLGTMYVQNRGITFVIDKKHKALFENGQRFIRDFKFPAKKVEDDLRKFLPQPVATIESGDYVGFVLRKTDDVLSLKDVLAHFGGQMPPKHACWVISRLFNLACWMQIEGVVHNSLSVDDIFISPPYHAVSILGGWWYAKQAGSSLRGQTLPARTLNVCPKSLFVDKIANTQVNGELIKALGREILGDLTGPKLRMNKDIPQPLAEWLMTPAGPDVLKDYEIWREKVLKDSYGERRFTKLEITSSDIY